MIEFGKMTVEGYGPVQEETFYWDRPGMNIIQAANGSGKTTFINALVWVLYGKPLSGAVDPWEHTRTSSYKGTKVVQDFMIDDLEFTVTRYKNYPKFKNAMVLEIDSEIDKDLDKKETQQLLETHLGYTYELFKNSIIFGQKLKRLIAETGPNKKKVFDDAFEVTYISKAKDIANEKLKELRTEFSTDTHNWEMLVMQAEAKDKEIQAQQKLLDSFEDTKKTRIKAQKEHIKAVKEKIKVIEDNEDVEANISIQEYELEIFEKDSLPHSEIVKLEKSITKLEMQRDMAKKDTKDTRANSITCQARIDNMVTACDKCGKSYTAIEQKTAKKTLKKYLSEHEENYAKALVYVSILTGQIQELTADIASANKLLESIDIINEELNRLEVLKGNLVNERGRLRTYKENIQAIRKEKLDDTIFNLTIELSGITADQREKAKLVRKSRRDVETYEWLVKDPLSNSGLKAFIFNMMLDDINERLEYYTTFIGLQVGFMIDMQSANRDLQTYVFKDDEPVPYDDLSGGQQQLVDIVTAFAIHDIVSDSKECSLLVLDEVFESLDKDNIEIITELIQDKAQTKCLYLVTHRAEFNPTNANIIKISFNGTSSTIV